MAGESTGRVHVREDMQYVLNHGKTIGVGTEVISYVVDESGGVLSMVTGTTDNNNAFWKGIPGVPSNGGLFIEAKVKLADITIGAYNVGFTNLLDDTTPVMPFEFDTVTLTTTAVDGAAFLYDIDATTDVWRVAAVDTNVDTLDSAITAFGTIANGSGVAPVNDTYEVFRVEIQANGTAEFWRNGTRVARQRSAVTPSAVLFPYVGVEARTAAATTLEVQYIEYGFNRG